LLDNYLDLDRQGFIIGWMKCNTKFVVGLICIVLGSVPALGQVSEAKQLDTDVPRLTGDNVPGWGIPWTIAAVLSAGILLLAFKNAKRNHMD